MSLTEIINLYQAEKISEEENTSYFQSIRRVEKENSERDFYAELFMEQCEQM